MQLSYLFTRVSTSKNSQINFVLFKACCPDQDDGPCIEGFDQLNCGMNTFARPAMPVEDNNRAALKSSDGPTGEEMCCEPNLPMNLDSNIDSTIGFHTNVITKNSSSQYSRAQDSTKTNQDEIMHEHGNNSSNGSTEADSNISKGLSILRGSAPADFINGNHVLEQADSRASSSSESSKLLEPTMRRPFKPSSSKRQQLIAKEAVEIYLLRPKTKAGKLLRRGSMAHCKVCTIVSCSSPESAHAATQSLAYSGFQHFAELRTPFLHFSLTNKGRIILEIVLAICPCIETERRPQVARASTRRQPAPPLPRHRNRKDFSDRTEKRCCSAPAVSEFEFVRFRPVADRMSAGRSKPAVPARPHTAHCSGRLCTHVRVAGPVSASESPASCRKRGPVLSSPPPPPPFKSDEPATAR